MINKSEGKNCRRVSPNPEDSLKKLMNWLNKYIKLRLLYNNMQWQSLN